MNTQTEMKRQEAPQVAQQQRDDHEPVLLPPVDIYEDGHGIVVKADLPGVSRERLTVEINDDTLSIDGRISLETAETMEALYADVQATRYLRRFTLSRELATDKINAQIDNGVLTVRIPKREEHRPRKIEVSAA